MIDWINPFHKEYPEFWRHYLGLFEHKPQRFVVIQADMTGTQPDQDVIISLSAVGIDAQNRLCVGDTFEMSIMQYRFTHDQGLSHEWIIQAPFDKRTEDQAIQAFIAFLGNAVLVGHRLHPFIGLCNKALERLKLGRLRNEAIDLEIVHQKLTGQRDKAFSKTQIWDHYRIPVSDQANLSDEAYALAMVFLKVRKKIGIL